MRSPTVVIIFLSIMMALDYYFFLAIKAVSQTASPKTKFIIGAVYWGITILAVIGFMLFVFTDPAVMGKKTRTYLFAFIVGLFLAKLIAMLFFLTDDLRRAVQWSAGKAFPNNSNPEKMVSEPISRSVFLSWLGIAAGGTLFSSLIYGFTNKYNYEIKRIKLAYANLPAAFKGLKIVHISDIHSGSLLDIKAVEIGVEKILKEKADLILFTGDLVSLFF